jgi:hypothetical protein
MIHPQRVIMAAYVSTVIPHVAKLVDSQAMGGAFCGVQASDVDFDVRELTRMLLT